MIQGTYNESTGAVSLEVFMANYVSPSAGTEGWETVKAYVGGNTVTHTFTVNIVRNGSVYDHQITGHGVSQGTGYFLLKIEDNELLNDGQDNFYVINATDTAAALAAKDTAKPSGDTTASAAGDTSGYAASLPAAFDYSVLPADTAEAEALDLTLPEPTILGPIPQ